MNTYSSDERRCLAMGETHIWCGEEGRCSGKVARLGNWIQFAE